MRILWVTTLRKRLFVGLRFRVKSWGWNEDHLGRHPRTPFLSGRKVI